ncbi:MAG: EAL domain-containing protein [Proteobacteria bacterium]|nr:EAL domain-containing protein [Pseudomonadota bacterium]
MRLGRKTDVRNILVRRALAVGLLVFVLAAGLLLPLAHGQYRRNTADLASATRVQAIETAVRLQQEIDHHLGLLELLRSSLIEQGDFSEARFRTEAGAIESGWPAFQAINWLDVDGRILHVVPHETNRSAIGLDVTQVPLAAGAFRRSLESARVAATPPLQLRQGGRGVVVYLRVHDEGTARGVINGVFRLDTLFGALLGDGLLERYAIEVSDGDSIVYAAGRIAEAFVDQPRTSVIFDQRNWRLLLAPRAEHVADFAAQFRDQAIVILGLALLGGLLAGLLSWKQMSLRHTERRFRELNRLLPDMVLECDETWRVTYLNQLAQEHLGYTTSEVGAGLALAKLLTQEDLEKNFVVLRDELDEGESVTRLCSIRCADGSVTACEVTLGTIRDDAGRFRGLRAVLRDITERIETERAMNRLANFDSTTELPNRAMFLQVLDHELRQAQTYGRRLTLIVIDLDNFKNINDRLGPSMGDLLLHEAGQRLRDALKQQEYVFRVSGDEFAVLFDNLESVDRIEQVALMLLNALRQPYRLEPGSEETINATAGISIFPDDASSAEQLYMHADAAVYEAKAEGGRRHRIFTHEISRQLNERKHLEESLRHALRNDEFKLLYQPIVNAQSGNVIGLEALIRWEHPERGLLTPYHFIRLAEETGLIDEIGAWVLQESCRQMVLWDRQGVVIPHVSVNVSAHQLESGVLGTDVRRALHDHHLDGERLVLELTESLLMRDVHFASRTLAALKRSGVRTAVDDFGTGYSSLAYLNRLPIDALKIDRAFIAPIAEEGGDTRVTEAVIALGRSLKLDIVAEGVETREQAEFLVAHGCATMQGYFFSRPVRAEEIGVLVTQDWRMPERRRVATGGK